MGHFKVSDRHQILKIFNKSLIIILSVASKCDCPRWFLHRPSLSDNVDKRMIADTQMYYSRFTNFLNIGCKNKINQSLGCFGYSGGLLNKLSHLDLKHKEFQSSRLRQTTLHVTIKITKYQTFLLFCCLELSSKLVIESLIIMLKLYRAFILPHLEYCSPLLLGMGKVQNSRLEDADYYILRSILGHSKSVPYEQLLRSVSMKSLEHRRNCQSLNLLYKCLYCNGPLYIRNFFNFRNSSYNLRGIGTTLSQPNFNLKWMKNSFTSLPTL